MFPLVIPSSKGSVGTVMLKVPFTAVVYDEIRISDGSPSKNTDTSIGPLKLRFGSLKSSTEPSTTKVEPAVMKVGGTIESITTDVGTNTVMLRSV